MTAWRIVKQKYPAAQAFAGEGARLYGGRWNSRGVSVVYAAGSQSLAVLEMLVHLDAADLLQSYVLFAVKIDEAQMSALVEAATGEPVSSRTAKGRSRRCSKCVAMARLRRRWPRPKVSWE